MGHRGRSAAGGGGPRPGPAAVVWGAGQSQVGQGEGVCAARRTLVALALQQLRQHVLRDLAADRVVLWRGAFGERSTRVARRPSTLRHVHPCPGLPCAPPPRASAKAARLDEGDHVGQCGGRDAQRAHGLLALLRRRSSEQGPQRTPASRQACRHSPATRCPEPDSRGNAPWRRVQARLAVASWQPCQQPVLPSLPSSSAFTALRPSPCRRP